MGTVEIAAAVRRVRALLEHRPRLGVHEDAPAVATWLGGLRVGTSHSNGTRILTDLPRELGGGDGDAIEPGWLLRAGLASCLATSIALNAAAEGIELEALEVGASSRSDVRGLLAVADGNGAPVGAGPFEMCLSVRIGAPGIAAERLNALIEQGYRCSPLSAALRDSVPVELRVEIDGG
ncbi:MAG TPA: OsmC family protein [Steroidobacteraceae bacterium]|nr:OsmC family protein [Steroidobacteraceae bacterium]